MTTEELISMLEKQFKGWNRDGDRGILPYLNIAQKILCSVPSKQFLVFDESTGKLPTITTVDGTFTYDLPSTINFIDMILVEDGPNVSVSFGYQDYGRSVRSTFKAYEAVEFSGIAYFKIPYVRSYPATENDVAKVIFTENPESSTDKYMYYGYKKPIDLVSDAIPLSIHPPFDALYLLPATAKLMEGVEHGNYVDAVAYIHRDILPEMNKKFNVGAFGDNHNAVDRGH